MVSKKYYKDQRVRHYTLDFVNEQIDFNFYNIRNSFVALYNRLINFNSSNVHS